MGPKDGVKVKAFYEMYLQFCKGVGISLQDPKEASEDKAYGLTHCGSMLGVWFNTKSWRWWLDTDKVSRYVNDLADVLKFKLGTERNADVKITKLMREQIRWWIPMIQLVGEGLPIPSPYDTCPPTAVEADSYAAGGSMRGVHGVGIVKGNAWAFLQWPAYINSKKRCFCGSMFRHKLS